LNKTSLRGDFVGNPCRRVLPTIALRLMWTAKGGAKIEEKAFKGVVSENGK
jgi:hypothetical protein